VPGVELRSGQRLQDASRLRLGSRGSLKQLGGRCRTASSQQIEPAAVQRIGIVRPGMSVPGRTSTGIWTGIIAVPTRLRSHAGVLPAKLFAGTGILATC